MAAATTTIKPFAELSLDELYDALAVRNAVFGVEQRITAVPDLDHVDPACWHALLRDHGRVVGTCRLLPLDEGRCIKVGRLAVLADHRSQGHGKAILHAVHAWLDQRALPAVMHAQRYLEAYYTSLGWHTVGQPFDEAGIEHVKMQRPAGGVHAP